MIVSRGLVSAGRTGVWEALLTFSPRAIFCCAVRATFVGSISGRGVPALLCANAASDGSDGSVRSALRPRPAGFWQRPVGNRSPSDGRVGGIGRIGLVDSGVPGVRLTNRTHQVEASRVAFQREPAASGRSTRTPEAGEIAGSGERDQRGGWKKECARGFRPGLRCTWTKPAGLLPSDPDPFSDRRTAPARPSTSDTKAMIS